jgi:hypothetical protein
MEEGARLVASAETWGGLCKQPGKVSKKSFSIPLPKKGNLDNSLLALPVASRPAR